MGLGIDATVELWVVCMINNYGIAALFLDLMQARNSSSFPLLWTSIPRYVILFIVGSKEKKRVEKGDKNETTGDGSKTGGERRNQRYWLGMKETHNGLLVQLLDSRPGEVFVVASRIAR
ncbi:uncharacterized protein TrAFT101_002658 [Trichoderma asperellum]|uniref:uncharacterized protein n=1 Tax=Trichoderma asperellum TaxID=101201 RepID=UPI003321B912|nr:hypothetical protein TrAFT101_002658 [Trichoderma asperellum]